MLYYRLFFPSNLLFLLFYLFLLSILPRQMIGGQTERKDRIMPEEKQTCLAHVLFVFFFFFCLMAFTEYTHTSIEVQITHIYRYKHTFICHFQNAQSSYNMTQAHKLLLFLFLSDILVLPAKKCYLKSQLKRCLSKIIISNACILLYNSTHGLSTKIGEKMLPWGWE